VRLQGGNLVGRQLWQYRFDTATLAAAEAPAGQGTWQPAHVLDYVDATGEHEVRHQHAHMVGSMADRTQQPMHVLRACQGLSS
jgi:hypothetical protein